MKVVWRLLSVASRDILSVVLRLFGVVSVLRLFQGCFEDVWNVALSVVLSVVLRLF